MELHLDHLYLYKVTLVKVVDGDTVDLNIDLGFNLKQQLRFRLYGINTPEKKLSTYQAGVDAELFLSKLISPASQSGDLFGFTLKDGADKYGRYLVKLVTHLTQTDAADPKSTKWDPLGQLAVVNDVMVQSGHAVQYML